MDKEKTRKTIEKFIGKLRMLDNSYDEELIKFDVDVEDLDRRYDERYNGLIDKLVEELKGV